MTETALAPQRTSIGNYREAISHHSESVRLRSIAKHLLLKDRIKHDLATEAGNAFEERKALKMSDEARAHANSLVTKFDELVG